jgi:hypothetical protein
VFWRNPFTAYIVYGALAEANTKVPLGDRASLDALGTSVLAALALP